MNILSGKLTGHRPATIVGNMNLKGNGDLQMQNCAKLKFVVFSFVSKKKHYKSTINLSANDFQCFFTCYSIKFYLLAYINET